MSALKASSSALKSIFYLAFILLTCVDATPVLRDSPSVLRRQTEATPHPLDYAPDFSKDPFPPWPDVKNPDGSDIETQNWRGTKLFVSQVLVQSLQDRVEILAHGDAKPD